MLRKRVIPALLLRNESLVKTRRFDSFNYVGDPCNTVRIFNELEVDELVILDVTASIEERMPNLRLLANIANECFMPLAYGGGIKKLDHARAIFEMGFEKVVVNTHAIETPEIIKELVEHYGSQAVIVSIDVKKDLLGNYYVRTFSGTKKTAYDPVELARQMEELGAGEILLTSIDQEGTWNGFDLILLKHVVEVVNIPVIAHGGAGKIAHIGDALNIAGASAVALGNMVVYQKKGMGVLVNFPDKNELEKVII